MKTKYAVISIPEDQKSDLTTLAYEALRNPGISRTYFTDPNEVMKYLAETAHFVKSKQVVVMFKLDDNLNSPYSHSRFGDMGGVKEILIDINEIKKIGKTHMRVVLKADFKPDMQLSIPSPIVSSLHAERGIFHINEHSKKQGGNPMVEPIPSIIKAFLIGEDKDQQKKVKGETSLPKDKILSPFKNIPDKCSAWISDFLAGEHNILDAALNNMFNKSDQDKLEALEFIKVTFSDEEFNKRLAKYLVDHKIDQKKLAEEPRIKDGVPSELQIVLNAKLDVMSALDNYEKFLNARIAAIKTKPSI